MKVMYQSKIKEKIDNAIKEASLENRKIQAIYLGILEWACFQGISDKDARRMAKSYVYTLNTSYYYQPYNGIYVNFNTQKENHFEVYFVKTTKDHIDEAIDKAAATGLKLAEITLTETEWKEFNEDKKVDHRFFSSKTTFYRDVLIKRE